MAKCIGIDLGTTNSCISYIEGKEMQVVPSAEGSRVIPSLIAISPDGKRIFGHAAKRQLVTHAQNTIWGIKRLMGRKYQTEEVRELKKRIGYALVEAENGDIKVRLQDKLYSPEEISGFFLGYLKNAAEEFFGEPVTDAVITVPAFFNDAQRQATRVAGEIAGMNVIRIINEPTAALLAYGSRIHQDGFYAVYDLGGGTFDISIVEVNGEVFKVVSSLGDTFLGGSDFDARVVNWIFEEIEKESHHDLRDSLEIVQRVVQVAEKAKIELSFQPETKISLPYLSTAADGSPYHFERSLLRTQLEAFTTDLIDRTIELIARALDEIKVNRSQVLESILVGGQSRMPAVFQRMSDFFQKPPVVDINPEEVVAQGAALQAEIIKGTVKDIVLLDVTPLTLGVETIGDSFTKIIERNSTIPIKKSMIFTTVSENQTTVKIHVIQGERELASQNKSLGYFNLVGIPIMPKGMPQIDVTFEIDANGIVKVSAQDRSTGLSQSMKVQPASGLTPEEIERIVREAQQYNEEDRRQLHFKKIASQLQEELDTAKYYYNRYIDKLNPHDGAEIDTIISRSQEALQGDSVAAIEELHKKMKSFRILINNILAEELSH